MKSFDISTKFENDTAYLYRGDLLRVSICNTVRLTEKIYRATYPSKKDWLDTAIYLKGLSNVTLDFGGATLCLCDDSIQPFVLDECDNVTIKNVVVEYERSQMDEIDIIDVRDGEIWLRQTEKQKRHFPLKIKDGRLVPIAGDKEYYDAFSEPHFFNMYDRETLESCGWSLVRIGRALPTIPHEQFPFKYYELEAEQRGDFIVLSGEIPPNIVSDVTSAQTHSARDLNSCFIICSKNTRLENFRVLNGGGMGVMGMYSENITLDGLKYFFDDRSHGIATNSADALHLISCFGCVKIVNSIFEGMKDDAMNIHGHYYTVEGIEGKVIHARLKTDVQKDPAVNAWFKMFGTGDKIALYEGATMFEKLTLEVEKVDVTSDFSLDLTVLGDTSGLCVGDTIENLSIQADLHIKNCRFGKASTHLRLQTRGKILMEDCECSLKVLLPGDKTYWYEASPVTDLTIRNCSFKGKNACIWSHPKFKKIAQAPYYHSGIKVINNTFDAEVALDVADCRDLLFEGNTNSAGLPFKNILTNCND